MFLSAQGRFVMNFLFAVLCDKRLFMIILHCFILWDCTFGLLVAYSMLISFPSAVLFVVNTWVVKEEIVCVYICILCVCVFLCCWVFGVAAFIMHDWFCVGMYVCVHVLASMHPCVHEYACAHTCVCVWVCKLLIVSYFPASAYSCMIMCFLCPFIGERHFSFAVTLFVYV